MRTKVLFLAALFLVGAAAVSAQRLAQPQTQPQAQPQPIYQGADPVMVISAQLTAITQAIQTMNQQMKVALEKGGAEGSPADKRQKIVAGLQMLSAAEQRVIILQNYQFDLTTKVNDTRAKLTQVDIDLRPRSIDRSVQFEGTTETEELRDARRTRLTNERGSLMLLMQQLQTQLSENADTLREASNVARTLRKTWIPQLEKELAEP